MSFSISDSSNTYNFFSLSGWPLPEALSFVEITRPAVNGRAFRLEGTKGDPFSLYGIVDVANYSTAVTLISAYRALKGQACTITKISVPFQYYLCLDGQVKEIRKVGNLVGGLANGSWLVFSEFRFVYQGDT